MWARHGGNLGLRCTHSKVAGTGLKGLFAGGGGGGEEEEDVLDSIPAIAQADDDMVVAAEGEEGEEGDAAGPGPIAEGVEWWQMAAAEEDEKAAGVETEGAWWDGWLEDVEYEGTAGEADEEVVDAGEVEDMFDLEELVEELLARAAHGRTGPVAAMAGLVNEEGEDEECGDESEGRLLPPGPVAEGLADSMKSPLMSMTGGKKTDKNSDMLGNVLTMWEPKIEVTDPFLIDAAYTGQPAYMQPANVLAAAGDAELDGLAAAVKAAAADVGVEPLLEGEALRLRNMFWYNRGLSPAEFKLKPGRSPPLFFQASQPVSIPSGTSSRLLLKRVAVAQASGRRWRRPWPRASRRCARARSRAASATTCRTDPPSAPPRRCSWRRASAASTSCACCSSTGAPSSHPRPPPPVPDGDHP